MRKGFLVASGKESFGTTIIREIPNFNQQEDDSLFKERVESKDMALQRKDRLLINATANESDSSFQEHVDNKDMILQRGDVESSQSYQGGKIDEHLQAFYQEGLDNFNPKDTSQQGGASHGISNSSPLRSVLNQPGNNGNQPRDIHGDIGASHGISNSTPLRSVLNPTVTTWQQGNNGNQPRDKQDIQYHGSCISNTNINRQNQLDQERTKTAFINVNSMAKYNLEQPSDKGHLPQGQLEQPFGREHPLQGHLEQPFSREHFPRGHLEQPSDRGYLLQGHLDQPSDRECLLQGHLEQPSDREYHPLQGHLEQPFYIEHFTQRHREQLLESEHFPQGHLDQPYDREHFQRGASEPAVWQRVPSSTRTSGTAV